MVDNMNQVPASSDAPQVTIKVEPTENVDHPAVQTSVNGPSNQMAMSETTKSIAEPTSATFPVVKIKQEVEEEIVRTLVPKTAPENSENETKPNVTFSGEKVGEESNKEKEVVSKVSKGSADVVQNSAASTNMISQTVKQEIDESSINNSSEVTAGNTKATDNVTKESSLLRSTLRNGEQVSQNSSVGQHSDRSNETSTTKAVENSSEQPSGGAVVSVRDFLFGPDMDTSDLLGSSGSEREDLESTARALVKKIKAAGSRNLLGDPPRNNAVQKTERVNQPKKTSAGETKMHSCIACGMSFRFHSTLKTHLARDVKKLSYECKHCAKKMVFYNQCKLIKHIRMHGSDAVLPDMADLLTRIPKSHPIFCNEISLEAEDSDSEIEVYDVDCQPSIMVGEPASAALKSDCTVEPNSARAKSEMRASVCAKDYGSAHNSIMSEDSSVAPAARRPECSHDISDTIVGRAETTGSTVGSIDTAVNKSSTAVGSLQTAVSKSSSVIGSLATEKKSKTAVGSLSTAESRSESAVCSLGTSESRSESAVCSLGTAESRSESAVCSLGSAKSRSESAVCNLGIAGRKSASAVNSLKPVVSSCKTAVKSPNLSQSKGPYGNLESAANRSNSSVGSLDHASKKLEAVSEKSQQAVNIAGSTSNTGTHVASGCAPSVRVPSSYAVRHTESTSMTTVVRHISSAGPASSGLRPAPPSSVRPVLSVRPFNSVKTMHSYKWVSSVATQVSLPKPNTVVTSQECAVGKPAVAIDKPAVTSSEPVYVGLRVKGFALEQNSDTLVICNECKKKIPLGELQNHFQTPNPLLSTESLQCSRCDLILPTICSYHAHKRVHFKHVPFVCPECGHVFTTFELLTSHLQNVCFHLQKCVCYFCTFCKAICKTAEELVDHILESKHFMYAFVCTACTTVHRKFPELQLHMEKHHDPAKQPSKKIYYECLLCPKKLISVPELRLHAATHPRMLDSLVYYYKCGVCNVAVYSKDKFAAHKESCSGTVPVHTNVRPSHKLIVTKDGNASAAQTVLIQAVDLKGNVTFQRQLVRRKLLNGQNTAFASPLKVVRNSRPVPSTEVVYKNTNLVPNTNAIQKTTNPVPEKNLIGKNSNPVPNSRVINFVDANAECESSYSVNDSCRKNGAEMQVSAVSAEENEAMFTSVLDRMEENEKDPLSLEGMEPSKTTTSSCVVCGKFVERSLIRSEVQRVPVRCASCVARSCYESKSKNGTLVVVSPKSISSSNLQPENGPARKKRRLSSSGTNDKSKCRRCFCPLPADYSGIQNHYKTVHNEDAELSPEVPEQAEKEHASSSTEEDKLDKKNGADQSVRNGSCTKTKKRKKTPKNAESKCNAPSAPAASGDDGGYASETTTENNTKSDHCQKDVRDGYCCNFGNCQFSTNDASVFKEHIIKHRVRQYIFQCMICGFACKSGFSFSYHLMTEHGIVDAQGYVDNNKECYFGGDSESSDCDSNGSWSESLVSGNAGAEEVGENGCRVCRETFDSSQELEQHIRTHGMAFLVHMKRNRESLLDKQKNN